ncbi:hypothetical protein [Mycobacterium malmoense]|uniref:hypothetical protein n=1 Tax=Mycobacterium malmoense TaxID=1780 RepID=UPI0008F959C8|nr:hypothetical protein [Mycobacterium malmoense]OIN79763.1 hypothetical protein BMG05_16590 [Mycobacterium malmoense]
MTVGGQVVTVVNSGQPTGYNGVGEPIYGDPALTVVAGCSLQQLHSHRDINLTDVAVARARLFTPATAPLTATSIVAAGVISSWPLAEGDDTVWYLVDGEPAVWADLNGVADHIECYLKREAG